MGNQIISYGILFNILNMIYTTICVSLSIYLIIICINLSNSLSPQSDDIINDLPFTVNLGTNTLLSTNNSDTLSNLVNCYNFLGKWAICVVVNQTISFLYSVHSILKTKYQRLVVHSLLAKIISTIIYICNYIGGWLIIGYAISYADNSDIDNTAYQVYSTIYIYMLSVNVIIICIYVCTIGVICYIFCHTEQTYNVDGADATTIGQNTVIKKFSEWMGIDDIDTKCAICMDEYKRDDKITKMHCGHYYHTECINEWLTKSAICPYCKQQLKVGVDLTV